MREFNDEEELESFKGNVFNWCFFRDGDRAELGKIYENYQFEYVDFNWKYPEINF